MRCLRILGTRGIPASHGGFETFAEHLALYLIGKGWRVVVYCQDDGSGPVFTDTWQGVERLRIPVAQEGPLGTMVFDWQAIAHAARYKDLCLTLGYNTAVFCALLRLKGIPNLINMDGIEWSRAKWGPLAKTWFWLNDWAGCWLGNHLIADHPRIQAHLQSRVPASKITMIPYGADAVTSAPLQPLQALRLLPGLYLTVIARAEPDNSLLEIVKGFSVKPRGLQLLVLGNYEARNAYHCAVKAAASPEVVFAGAVYDQRIVQALRFHCTAYVHGHRVGGTNPSLVEALGAGNAVIAHNNRFNRWVAGRGAAYFTDADSFSRRLDELLANPATLAALRQRGTARFNDAFGWTNVLDAYAKLLTQYMPTSLGNGDAEASRSGKQSLSFSDCGKVSVFGLNADNVDMAGAVDRIERSLVQNDRLCSFVVTANVDHVVMLDASPEFRDAYDHAAMVLIDGNPIVWASRLLRVPLQGTVPGSDLVPAIFDHVSKSWDSPLAIYLLGAGPNVAERAKVAIEKTWAKVRVVGLYSPALGFEKDESECMRICDHINNSGAALLVIGLGAPKQELWVHKHAAKLHVNVALCAGATIDFLAGEKKRAPIWMRRWGLEWFHRMCSEPRRLTRRYARDAVVFPRLVLRELMRKM